MGRELNTIDWLLEDDAPAVQYLARMRLLGEPTSSRRLVALRRRCNEYPPTARMLDRVDEAIAVGNYAKYRGAYWTLIFLADLHADEHDPRVGRLVHHVLGAQLENGGFSASGGSAHEIVCLTANILRSLVHFGYGENQRVLDGYKRLAERILPHGGVPCVALLGSLHTACKMTLPQTLRCLAVTPSGAPRTDMKKLRELLVKQMLSVRVYRYVRPDARLYSRRVLDRPKGVPQREVRLQLIKENKFRDDELLPKMRWKRFGFPRGYNPDLLEAMLTLAELGAALDPVLNDPLDHIEKKRRPDGRWNMDDSLNGKMLADVERKGRPSKWITLRALTVLQHFGRIRL